VSSSENRFHRVFRLLLPSQFRTGEGELVDLSLMTMLSLAIERVRLGWLARFPTHAPSDALPLMSRDRKIVRGFSESETTFRARLIAAPTDHRTRGNPWALMKQIRAYLGTDLMVRTVDNRGNWYTIEADGTQSTPELDAGNFDWDGDAAKWSRFWVILYPPSTLWTRLQWGDVPLPWGNASYTWGSTATPEQVRSIRNIVKDWKPAGTRCVNVIIAFDAASFDPTDPPGAPLPDGTWDLHGDRATGTRGRSRLSTALYWKGTS
jgi:hypothetical protein